MKNPLWRRVEAERIRRQSLNSYDLFKLLDASIVSLIPYKLCFLLYGLRCAMTSGQQRPDEDMLREEMCYVIYGDRVLCHFSTLLRLSSCKQ